MLLWFQKPRCSRRTSTTPVGNGGPCRPYGIGGYEGGDGWTLREADWASIWNVTGMESECLVNGVICWCFFPTVFKPEELRQALMPTLEALYRQDPESLPFRQPVDPQLLGIPVSSHGKNITLPA